MDNAVKKFCQNDQQYRLTNREKELLMERKRLFHERHSQRVRLIKTRFFIITSVSKRICS
ncbi:MAG: hypothetical protein DRI57_11780 [Deltaproteobacteria bacterium]|nr:MAG: hypothetical protein DRI57_11780 [Deltaproteobacteria bacterium]